MRVHKYRAWHEENKMMYYSHMQDGSDNPLWCWDVVFREGWHDECVHKMEWTGINDKHGNEIYEGDICKTKQAIYEDVSEVIWDDLSFRLRAISPLPQTSLKKFERGKTMCICSYFEFEVIGNIFENTELIK